MSGGAIDAGASAGIVPAEPSVRGLHARLSRPLRRRGEAVRRNAAQVHGAVGHGDRSVTMGGEIERDAFLHLDIGECRDHVLQSRNPELVWLPSFAREPFALRPSEVADRRSSAGVALGIDAELQLQWPSARRHRPPPVRPQRQPRPVRLRPADRAAR